MIRFFAKGVNFLLGKSLLKKRVFIGGSLDFLHREREIDKDYFDYIRLSTLELVSQEVRKHNLKGNVAELGVYKGKFAKYINKYFPDRSLYLLDTFEGFDERDVRSEQQQDFSAGNQDFSKTSVEAVLQSMPFREKCIIVKGFFPESAKDLHDDFVFVSLDADLYEPIYNGLRFFYPRLVKGGYIFIHDFNNDHYKGARRAVEQFCAEQHINFVPLPDSGGSAIIAK
ncbi:MAG TPA: TylF/MycF/NovP-related O-methyltransferase [Puia sp.]|nr:TylF/MycF/NovP-related O-methyltransferase [Puia sp.]